jgi:hypothetical protein
LRKIIDEPSGAPQILHKAPEYKHHRELQEFYFGIVGFCEKSYFIQISL